MSEELNQDDLETLVNLLLISSKVKAREALYIRIGISYYRQLGFINDPSEESFAINLIKHLNDVGNLIPVLLKKEIDSANSQVSPPSVEVEQELSDSDIEILTDLLIRSGRAAYLARKALCIRIRIDPNQLEFLRQSTDTDFALELINYLHNIDDKQAICKICKELEIVFKRGKYSADLENIKSKINCK